MIVAVINCVLFDKTLSFVDNFVKYIMTSFLGSIPTVAQLKSQLDEVRAQVYPRNETEKKVIIHSTILGPIV